MGGDLETGLTYFELERVEEVKKTDKQIFDVLAYKRNFYLSLGIQLLVIYFICHTIQENTDLKNIINANPVFYIASFLILIWMSVLLLQIEIITFSTLALYVIYTCTLACCFSLFIQYYPEIGFYTLYYTIIIAFILAIFANCSRLEESGYSVVVSLLLCMLLLSVISNKSTQLQSVIGILLIFPFCVFSIYKLSNLEQKEKVEGYYLILSLLIYTCFLFSFWMSFSQIISNCCEGISNCCNGISNCCADCCRQNPCCVEECCEASANSIEEIIIVIAIVIANLIFVIVMFVNVMYVTVMDVIVMDVTVMDVTVIAIIENVFILFQQPLILISIKLQDE